MTTPEPLSVYVVQQSVVFWDIPKNIQRVDKLVNSIPSSKKIDLIVLPETFPSGFTSVPSKVSEPAGSGPGLQWMQKIAKSKSCAVAGSIVVHENDCYYNRLYFVFPDGSYEKYDKKHLYTMGNEADHFTPGSEKKIVVYKNWKINLAICYDLRFPVWLRNTKDNHYDILLIVAAWRSEKRHHWMSLTTARAIENQAYVIAANNCGLLPDSTPNSPDVVYTGDCRVIDPFGVPLKEARPGVEGVIHSVLDFNELDEWKQKFPVLGDQDSFQFC